MVLHVYALGSNGSGQLGIGHKEDVSVPKEVVFEGQPPQTVIEVKAGGNHTLLLSAGVLYCSGDRATGACGPTDNRMSDCIFHQVRLSERGSLDDSAPIVFFAATWEASIIVLSDQHGRANRVYTFGTGNKGELGQGELLFRSVGALLVKDFPPKENVIIDLAASVSHVVAVLNNGEVYGWGNGRKGQLGFPEEVIYKPRKIEGLDFKVVHAVCGREFTCLFGAPEMGRFMIIGSDKSHIVSDAPKEILHWKNVSASWGSVTSLQQDSGLISWGRDDHGQLSPSGLPPLKLIASGSEHTLALTTDGKVVAWGWGEHGNCGPNTKEGDVKGRWNVIASSQYLPPGSTIASIGTGCATSWICIME